LQRNLYVGISGYGGGKSSEKGYGDGKTTRTTPVTTQDIVVNKKRETDDKIKQMKYLVKFTCGLKNRLGGIELLMN
jgi:hypothetical protein